MSDAASGPIDPPQRSWYGAMPALAPEVGLIALIYGSIGPLLPLSDGARELDDALSSNWLWLLMALLVSSGLCALTAHFAVRFQLPLIKNFTNQQALNRIIESVYRLFFWTLPALGIGYVVAFLLCSLGVYSVRPYSITAVAAAAYFTAGIVGIRTLAAMDSEMSRPPSTIDHRPRRAEQ